MASEIDGLVEETEHERKEEGIEKTVQSLEKLFVACELQLQDIKKKQRQMLNEARPSARRQKIVWEVYAGKGRFTEECQRRGAIVRQQHEDLPEPHAASGAPGGGTLALPPPPDETNTHQPPPAADEVGDATVQADGQVDNDDQLAREHVVHNEALMRQFPTSAAARPTPAPIETDVMMDPEALPPVPEDDDLMSPAAPAASENFKLEQVKDNQRDREHFLPSALIIDAKALYDAIKAEVPQINGDKRTQIECMIVKQKMQNLKTQLRWVSSEVQLSDGLTKIQARQLLADRLRTHRISLMADSTFQAAKRKTMQERRDNARRNAISVKKSLTMMIIANELTPTRAQGEDDETGWDLTLLVIGTLLCIGAFQVVGWLIACWRQRTQPHNPTAEAQSQTEQEEQHQQPAPQRRETSDRLEARITQYKDFIKRGNETMDRVRKENERLEDQCKELEARCRELEIEVQARDVRQNLTDERLDEQQRMITQLERDLADIAQQAAYLNNHLGGIPQTVCITRHLRRDPASCVQQPLVDEVTGKTHHRVDGAAEMDHFVLVLDGTC
ncbi:unnamed protein product [Durusdinium trenchii]|uniref:Uncharacterized protein n=1 Tax=Durusdinium trenchii TaxID=1381693 RepID=A0ABP0NF26_9DINO